MKLTWIVGMMIALAVGGFWLARHRADAARARRDYIQQVLGSCDAWKATQGAGGHWSACYRLDIDPAIVKEIEEWKPIR